MRVVAMLCLGTAISLGLGCQRGQANAPLPISNTAPAAPVAAAAPTVPTEPAVSRPAQVSERVRITLPKAASTPVRRTRRPFTGKQLAWLSAFEFKDFDRQSRGTTDDAIEVLHTTKTGPKLGVTVRIDNCPGAPRAGAARNTRPIHAERVAPAPTDPGACVAMRLPLWETRREELKQFMSSDLAMRSDTRFYVGVDR